MVSPFESETDSDSESDIESVASAVICNGPSQTEIISRYEDFLEDLVKLSSGEINSSELLLATRGKCRQGYDGPIVHDVKAAVVTTAVTQVSFGTKSNAFIVLYDFIMSSI
jgi:hypothetical protein